MIKIGTSGFDYPDWKGHFYPDTVPRKEWLRYFATKFRALELNFSYYRMPTASGLESMLERTEGNVEFAIKAHRSMTHERVASPTDYEHFLEAIKPLREAGKLAAVLAQFPFSFKQTHDNRAYVKKMMDTLGEPLVMEFRQKDWSEEPIVNWLAKIGAGYCAVDEPALEGLMPRQALAAAQPAYVRFHGRNSAKWYEHDRPEERYDYRYSPRELYEWVDPLKALEKSKGDVLVFFNNHFQSKAVDSAQILEKLLLRKY